MTLLAQHSPLGAVAPGSAPLVRLRPIVHASPTARGVHVRGWASSFTVDGGPGVWRLWQAMARQLAEGVPGDQLSPPHGRPEVVRAAELILAQLREHDMLVEVPADWCVRPDSGTPSPALAGWLESVAADPAAAWRRLRAAQVRVAGHGPVARAASRALTGSGVVVTADRGYTTGTLLRADSTTAAAAGCHGEVGFVVPAGPPDQVTRVAAAVAARLGLPSEPDPAGPSPAGEPPYPLAALVGGAAAHRLVCAVAGLADPATEAAALHGDAAGALGVEYPAVLVARLDPLRATYHPWLPAAGPAPETSSELDAVLSRLDALCDPELGLAPVPHPGDLPQVPAALALAGGVLGVGATTDTARVDAALRAVEQTLAGHVNVPGTQVGSGRDRDRAGVAVGVDPRHATGVALRRLAHARLPELAATPVPELEWAGTAAARRWWKALTLRFAVPARARVRRLAPDAVHAEVVADGVTLGWAVEASPADAVGFAALAATGVAQARRAGTVAAGGPVTLTGAAPAWLPDQLDAALWTDPGWYWPAGVAAAEPRLQAALRRLVPDPLDPVPEATAPELIRSLAATGFVAVTVPGLGRHGRQS